MTSTAILFDNLADAMKHVRQFTCLWSHFGGSAVPVWWFVDSRHRRKHYVESLWSLSGPVAVNSVICFADDNPILDIPRWLKIAGYRSQAWPCRPLNLSGFHLSVVPIQYRHRYSDAMSKGKRDYSTPLFETSAEESS